MSTFLLQVQFGDIDNDGDQDVLLIGVYGTNEMSADLYLNDGAGNFSYVSDAGITGRWNGDMEFADVDGDEDLDLIITGGYGGSSNLNHVELYLNDGNGNFTEDTDMILIGSTLGSLIATDIDNDNDVDLFITGYTSGLSSDTKIYLNDGSGVFAPVEDMPFERFSDSKAIVTDVNGDNKKDILISGTDESGAYETKLYLNESCLPSYSIDTNASCELFEWIDGNTYTASNNTAVHTIFGGAETGCDSIVTLDLTITSINDNVSQSGTTLTAQSQPDATYQWLDCNNANAPIDGATGNTFEATVDGSYAVKITKGDCEKESTCYDIVGIGLEEAFLQGISLYPNPAIGVTQINIGNQKDVSLYVYDVFGKLVHQVSRIDKSNYTLDLKGKSGVYMVKLRSGNYMKQFKLILSAE